MPMKRFQTGKPALAISMAAMAVLAIAVFLWGLEYKCSLYHRHPEKRQRVVAAKLLSEKERPRTTPAASFLRVPLVSVTALIFLFHGIRRHRDLRTGLRFAPTVLPTIFGGHRSPSLIYFSFRPPPIPAC
jgi:hypothetical protein